VRFGALRRPGRTILSLGGNLSYRRNARLTQESYAELDLLRGKRAVSG